MKSSAIDFAKPAAPVTEACTTSERKGLNSRILYETLCIPRDVFTNTHGGETR